MILLSCTRKTLLMYRRSEDLCSNQINSVSCLSPPPTYFTHMDTTPANCCKICLEIFIFLHTSHPYLSRLNPGGTMWFNREHIENLGKSSQKSREKSSGFFFNRNNQLDSMVTRRGQLIRNETIFILIVKESLFKFSFTLTQNFCYDIFPI